jgi:DNA mismatch repair ATPase MutS
MNWILTIITILFIAKIISNRLKKVKVKKLKKKFNDSWGNPKKDTYFNFHSISRYFKNNGHKDKAFHIISNKTALDLDIDELFKFIDRTSSKIGQQYLYFKLRTVGTVDELFKFNTLVDVFVKNKKLRLNCQLLLSQLNHNNAYDLEELINGEQIRKPRTFWLVCSLSVISLSLFLLGFLNSIFFLFLIPVYFINMIFHYRNKSNINYYINGVSQLSKSLQVAKNISELNGIDKISMDFSFIKKINTLKFKTEFIGFENKIGDEFTTIIWLGIELTKALFNIEYIMFFSLIDSIVCEKKSIEEMFRFIGEIDAAISTASIKSSGLKQCVPNFIELKKIHAIEIYHPLIENCILNNINLSNKSMLLTGSNMSGKTTYIRSIGLNSLLAQTLNICFAKEYSAPFFKLFSSIRVSDNIIESKSYYLEEVLTVKHFIEVSKDPAPCLFVLDELFKGTNSIERISGSKAILTYLNKNNIVLASSHDIELAAKTNLQNFQLFHFNESISTNNELIFDYKLKLGVLKNTNAIKILQLYKYPKEIIDETIKNINEFNL